MRKILWEGVIPGLLLGGWIVLVPSLFFGLFLATILAAGALIPTWRSAQKARRSLEIGIDADRTKSGERVLQSLCVEAGVNLPELVVYNPKQKRAVYAAVVGHNPALILCSIPLFDLPLREVKGALLHELGHIHYRHLLKRRILNVGTLYLAIPLLWASHLYLAAPICFGLALGTFSLRVVLRIAYEHFTEYQADMFSHQILPGAFKEFLHRQGNLGCRSWFSSHPAPASRISALS